jgi:hypothetical protein
MNGYTEKEITLINSIGYAHLIPHIADGPGLYRLCVEKAFVEDMKGPHIEALRRAYKAILNCSPYRHTEAFEKLLEF